MQFLRYLLFFAFKFSPGNTENLMDKLRNLMATRDKLNSMRIPTVQSASEEKELDEETQRSREVVRRQMKKIESEEHADLSEIFSLEPADSYDNSKLLSTAISSSAIRETEADSPSLFESVQERTQTHLERMSQHSQIRISQTYQKEEKIIL